MKNYIDLTRPLYHDIQFDPCDPMVIMGKYKTLKRDGYNLLTMNLSTHSGTHIDAPKHMEENGMGVGELDVTSFIGWATIIDVPGIKADDLIEPEDLLNPDSINEGDIVLIRTYWEAHMWGAEEYFTKSPQLSIDTLKFLSSYKIKALGVDMPVINRGSDEHRILFNSNIMIMEDLVNLDKIKTNKLFLVGLPLNIKEGDGAPARIIGFTKFPDFKG